jgi:hypothetical protein
LLPLVAALPASLLALLLALLPLLSPLPLASLAFLSLAIRAVSAGRASLLGAGLGAFAAADSDGFGDAGSGGLGGLGGLGVVRVRATFAICSAALSTLT